MREMIMGAKMNTLGSGTKLSWSKTLAVGSLAFAVCFGGLRASAQDQGPAEEQGGGQPGYDAPAQGPRANAQSFPSPTQRSATPPSTLTLPQGTAITARLIDGLSSDKNHPGDRFSASLEQPLVANGWVVARRGQIVMGRVVTAQKAGRGSGVSQLEVELNELTLVDGQVLPIRTQLVQSSAGPSNGRDAAVIGTTTVLGAAIGAIAGGGEGAAIGAGAGAAAGIAGVLTTRGRPTVLHPETLLSFRMDVPLAVSTENSRVAFHPAGEGDYAGDQDAYARRPQGAQGPDGRGPRPYYNSYPYPYYYSGGYPYPYYYGGGFGYYPAPLYFGFGFRGGFRGGFRR